jgi:pyrroloquinoline-quinone synthase
MRPDETIRCLDEMIQSRSILAHPFYVAWQRGELTREQLGTYASFYYPHVAAFPGYIERARDCAKNPLVRAELEDNLADELANPAPHNELWLDFAEEFGVDRAALETALPRPVAAAVVETFNARTSADTGGALAALYAYESQQPEVAKQKVAGLRERYGVTEAKSLMYFEVHAQSDVRHSEGERQAILQCLADGATHESVMESASEALDAYWTLLDGICEESDIKSC